MNFEQDLDAIMWSNDFLRVLDRMALIEIQDYINVRKSGGSGKIWWNDLADFHVTYSFRTLNSLTQALFNLHALVPIGLHAPPLEFVELIYSKLKVKWDNDLN